MKKLTRHISILTVLVIMAILAFASKGGGGEKKSSNYKNDFTPIRSLNNFTLKNSPTYHGIYTSDVEKDNKRLSFNTMITYEKGNTTYILPYKYKVNISPLCNTPTVPKTNLQFLGVKIKMPK
jgi:hypothetical protein